jgi:hypothetical protein
MQKIILLFFVAIFLIIQIIPVTRDNPPVTADFEGPSEVKDIFEKSCYDCHSNETVWPWYSRVAPISWLVAGDVSEGRENLNFSEWGTYSAKKQIKLAENIGEEIKEGEMPLMIYLILHSSAKLDERQKAIIYDWVASQTGQLPEDDR